MIPFRVIFRWVSKVIWDCLVFVHFRSLIGSKISATLSQPIRCKIKTNHELVARVFPRFIWFGWFYFEFSLAI